MAPNEGRAQSQQPATQGQGGGQAQTREHAAPDGQGKSKEPRTQGQGGNSSEGQAAPEGKGQPKGKAQSKQPMTQGQGGGGDQRGNQRDNQPQQGQREGQGQRDNNQKGAQGKNESSGNVTLTTEQRTTIRQTVLKGGNRVSNVNVSINVGTVVPRSVKLVTVPTTIIEIHPAWRGYVYFIVDERIIIVEPQTKKIVAVLVV